MIFYSLASYYVEKDRRPKVVAQGWGSRPHAGLYKIPVVISNPISETSGG